MIYPVSSTIEKRKPIFPSLEKVKLFVSDFLSKYEVDIQTQFGDNIEEYHKTIEKEFIEKVGMLIFLFQPSNTNKLQSKVYRLREFSESINLGLISEYSYLPVPLCKSFRRANYPHSPVFYCSPDAKTAIFETVPNGFKQDKSNLFLISEWEFRKNEEINITPFFAGNYANDSYLNQVSSSLLLNIQNSIEGLSDSEKTVFLDIVKFLSNLFVYENSYPITSFIAHSHLYSLLSPIRTELFIYPSTKADTKTINYAIHPNTVDQKMVLNRIFAIRIKNLEYDKQKANLNFNLERIGVNSNGIIHWQQPNAEIEYEFSNIIQSN